MEFTLIPDWSKKNLRCHICGSTKSVKYETTVIVIDNIPVDVGDVEKEVCICNKCALRMNDILEN